MAAFLPRRRHPLEVAAEGVAIPFPTPWTVHFRAAQLFANFPAGLSVDATENKIWSWLRLSNFLDDFRDTL